MVSSVRYLFVALFSASLAVTSMQASTTDINKTEKQLVDALKKSGCTVEEVAALLVGDVESAEMLDYNSLLDVVSIELNKLKVSFEELPQEVRYAVEAGLLLALVGGVYQYRNALITLVRNAVAKVAAYVPFFGKKEDAKKKVDPENQVNGGGATTEVPFAGDSKKDN